MREEGIDAEVNEARHYAESVRLLWEGTRQVCYGGIDTDQLISLCSIVAGLAEDRILRLQSGPVSSDSSAAIQQLREYHKSALEVQAWATAPAPEPDWSVIAQKLASVGAAPLEFRE